MSLIEIRKVTDRKSLDAFINFHYDLYQGNQYDAPICIVMSCTP